MKYAEDHEFFIKHQLIIIVDGRSLSIYSALHEGHRFLQYIFVYELSNEKQIRRLCLEIHRKLRKKGLLSKECHEPPRRCKRCGIKLSPENICYFCVLSRGGLYKIDDEYPINLLPSLDVYDEYYDGWGAYDALRRNIDQGGWW